MKKVCEGILSTAWPGNFIFSCALACLGTLRLAQTHATGTQAIRAEGVRGRRCVKRGERAGDGKVRWKSVGWERTGHSKGG